MVREQSNRFIDQIGRQDEKHVRMLTFVLPAHFESLLGEATEGRITQRALVNELKLLKRILKLQKVRQALKAIGTEPEIVAPGSAAANPSATVLIKLLPNGVAIA